MAIALLHQHGIQIAATVRERLKSEGLLGKEERTIKRLNKANLSVPQRSDPTQYKPYQVVQFHKAAGGFQPNIQYEISRTENGKVFARPRAQARGGNAYRDKQLPLDQADRFNVYTVNYMQVAKGDKVLFTRNDSKNEITNGELGTVYGFGW
jgi:hypothetical protein